MEGTFILQYVGTAMMDSRCVYSKEMFPWVIAEILRFSELTQVVLSIKAGHVTCFTLKEGNAIFDCDHHDVVQQKSIDDKRFLLITKANNIYQHVRLFKASTVCQVSEVLSTMRETGHGILRSASSPRVIEESPISPDSVSFEVLYVGRVRMSSRNAPGNFVDEALKKFKTHECDRQHHTESDSRRSSQSSGSSVESLMPLVQVAEDEAEEAKDSEDSQPPSAAPTPSPASEPKCTMPELTLTHPLQVVDNNNRSRHPSGDALIVKSMSLPMEPMRNRALSTGNYPRHQPLETNRIGSSQYNRTMILIVGRCEMKIISPDAKSLFFVKHFRDICLSVQGEENKDCFGFICKESGSHPSKRARHSGYVAYIFRCQSEPLSADILKVLQQASHQSASKKDRLLQSCEHCPMLWYRNLCMDVEGVTSADRVQLVILKHIQILREEEKHEILEKFHGAADGQSIQEQNELLMMLLRVHCETKQASHVHDTVENRHEFLNQFLGGGEIFTKARRSLTSSFDHFIKRKNKDNHQTEGKDGPSHPPEDEDDIEIPLTAKQRPRSSTLGSLDNIRPRRSSNASQSPMINLFQKMGSQSKTTPPATNLDSNGGSKGTNNRPGSWRHAIFKKVVSPSTPNSGCSSRIYHHQGTPLAAKCLFRPNRTPEEIRQLWKTAINQQIILIRMEKQNSRIRAKQQEADEKRLKLSYEELGVCDEEASDTWDSIMNHAQLHPNKKCDLQLLNSAVLRGIPKHKRGQVWQFFVDQNRIGEDPNIMSNLCHLKLNLTYEQLLRQLTSQQHAILIDLGRTFPTHSYFSSALGSGQLALFNILKAYSLLDTDVGYCQGLSFVAGLLLMHLEEEEAFNVLKFIMFNLGAREHYKPDMHELQVKLYQLTRMIHDQDPDLLLLLNHYDVLPSLYAAPWFLTLFASQFPVGFSVRVLDLLLLHGVDVIAKFAVVIILDHRKDLMECTGLEQIMECFKTSVTNISTDQLDKYLRKVLDSDWDKQMLTYSVEYSVMNDEAFHAFLTESSNAGSGTKCNKSDKSIQTDLQGNHQAEKHPILGDLIQRQNSEISKLKMEKADLRKDIQSLLNCISTMQQLAKISSNGRINLPVPPEVTSVASKYFQKCGQSYAGLLENGQSTGLEPGGMPSLDRDGNSSDESSDAGSHSHPLAAADSPSDVRSSAKLDILMTM